MTRLEGIKAELDRIRSGRGRIEWKGQLADTEFLVDLVDDLAEALRERLDGERCYCTVGVTPYPCGPCAGRAALNRLDEGAG